MECVSVAIIHLRRIASAGEVAFRGRVDKGSEFREYQHEQNGDNGHGKRK
jgi:hypothetical protein